MTAVPGTAPADTSASRLEREAKRRARIDPELMHADFVIHPDLGFGTVPTSTFFEHARKSGELTAKRLLPSLQAAMAEAEVLPKIISSDQQVHGRYN